MLGPAEHPGFEEGAVDDQLPAALDPLACLSRLGARRDTAD